MILSPRVGCLVVAAFLIAAVQAHAQNSDPDWKAQFEILEKNFAQQPRHRKEITAQIVKLLSDTFPQSQKSLVTLHADTEFLEQNHKQLNKENILKPWLAKFYLAYFQKAFAAATGPVSLQNLKAWCTQRNLKTNLALVEKTLSSIESPEDRNGALRKREQMRTNRDKARQAARDAMNKLQNDALALIHKLVNWMMKEGYAPEEARAKATQLVQSIGFGANGLMNRINNLKHTARDAKLKDQFEREFDRARKDCTRKLNQAASQCLAHGEGGLAFDLYLIMIHIDPDHSQAHQALGNVKHGNQWMRPYIKARLKDGFAWSDHLGWILEKETRRYARGEYFDLTKKKWDLLKNWNEIHSKTNLPWVLESEHFNLISTADLQTSAHTLQHMERFFLQTFRQYDLFFGSGKKLTFGRTTSMDKLTVWLYRDRIQYQAYSKPPIKSAVGHYSPKDHTSYFYVSKTGLNLVTAQHEITHQILGSFSGGTAPRWLAEGSAVFLESSREFRGMFTPGPLQQNKLLRQYMHKMRSTGSIEYSFTEMLTFEDAEDWFQGDEATLQRKYRGAGALTYFFMHMDGGRYRSDFIEMLRDGYRGKLKTPEYYFGLSHDSLNFLMQRFYVSCDATEPAQLTSSIGRN